MNIEEQQKAIDFFNYYTDEERIEVEINGKIGFINKEALLANPTSTNLLIELLIYDEVYGNYLTLEKEEIRLISNIDIYDDYKD